MQIDASQLGDSWWSLIWRPAAPTTPAKAPASPGLHTATINPWVLNPWGHAPSAAAKATVDEAALAVTKIQAIERGRAVRRSINSLVGQNIGKPTMANAREAMRALLPHDSLGRLLPLSCPIECFQVFGTGSATATLEPHGHTTPPVRRTQRG